MPHGSTSEVVLRVSNLYKYYDGVPILYDVSFEVRRGEVICIMGGSGCGKSTLLNVLIGSVKPEGGKVEIADHDEQGNLIYRNVLEMTPQEFREVRRRLGVAFQNGALYSGLTVEENLAFPMEEVAPEQYSPEHVHSWVEVNLRYVQMEDHTQKLPSQLSGGQIKRVAMARAFALDPDIVFYDEPSAGLDPLVSRDIDRLIKTLASLAQTTTVVITHELDSAFDIAHRMVLLKKADPAAGDEWVGATKVFDGTPDQIRAVEDSFIVEFLGPWSYRHPSHGKGGVPTEDVDLDSIELPPDPRPTAPGRKSEGSVKLRNMPSGPRIVFRGAIDRTNLDTVIPQLEEALAAMGPHVVLDLYRLRFLDKFAIDRLNPILRKVREEGSIHAGRASELVREALLASGTLTREELREFRHWAEVLAHRASGLCTGFVTELREHVVMARDLIGAAVAMVCLPVLDLRMRLAGKKPPKRAIKWWSTLEQMCLIGVDAIPVAGTILFMVGFVTAQQAIGQLAKFNAEIFVADASVRGMFRELGALMTAIVVAGRSGSSITAEIGAMKVQDEIKAMETMGLSPVRYVLAPRALGVLLAMPMLTILTATIGVLGGFLGGIVQDINLHAFYDRTINALMFVDLRDCLIKATVYGAVIGLVSCHRGKKVRGGAAAIGRATTSSVVECIFMVILCAAILVTILMRIP